MTERLKIAPVDESGPDTAVGNDVVNICRPDPGQVGQTFLDCPAAAFPAERFPQELLRPEIVGPDRQSVPGMPGCCLGAALAAILRAVLVAVAGPDQLAAAWVCAWAHRLQCHSDHLWGK